jgi:hypothetical protein
MTSAPGFLGFASADSALPLSHCDFAQQSLDRRWIPRRGFFAIPLIEAVNAPGCINQLLLAREEGMARGADFHVKISLFRRAALKAFAASAGDGYLVVFGMNSWLHYCLLPCL